MSDCKHPPSRLWAWYARDDSIVRKRKVDSVGSGGVMCVACCDCGAILKGGVELPSVDDEQDQTKDGQP